MQIVLPHQKLYDSPIIFVMRSQKIGWLGHMIRVTYERSGGNSANKDFNALYIKLNKLVPAKMATRNCRVCSRRTR